MGCVCISRRFTKAARQVRVQYAAEWPMFLICRMCIRFIPIDVVCHADLEDIKKTAKALVEQHFPADTAGPCIPFAVFYEHRASVKLNRMEVINSIVDQIPQVHRAPASTEQTSCA